MLGYVETVKCRRHVLLEYFGEKVNDSACENCDTCLDPINTFDGTVAVQKALSCIYRTDQMFGVAHIINVLLGKEDEKVKRFNHSNISTFGIGSEYDKFQWKSVFRQIIALGLANVDMESYGAVKLSAKSNKILRGEEKIFLRRDVMDRKSAKTKKTEIGKRSVLSSAEDESLFQKLRAYRLSLAKEQGIPPFVIFHDSTLIEIVSRRPGNLSEFADISGVGKSKLERYGPSFLEIVQSH